MMPSAESCHAPGFYEKPAFHSADVRSKAPCRNTLAADPGHLRVKAPCDGNPDDRSPRAARSVSSYPNRLRGLFGGDIPQQAGAEIVGNQPQADPGRFIRLEISGPITGIFDSTCPSQNRLNMPAPATFLRSK